MITIYTITYNEELMLPFMVSFYRERFPGCRIVVYDNYSTDNTIQFAKRSGCEVILFDTQNKMRDDIHRDIKNICWKSATTDWVLVCDCDELLDITAEQLKAHAILGNEIISTEAYDMVNLENDFNLSGIKHGVRAGKEYDKYLLFNRSSIIEINYNPGAHHFSPVTRTKKLISVYTTTGNRNVYRRNKSAQMLFEKSFFSATKYKIFHYKFINPDYMVSRYASFLSRRSEENKKNSWSGHYLETENTIRVQFEEARAKSEKIIN